VLSDSVLQEVLQSAGIDARVRYDEVTESTNTTATHMADEGAPEWTLVAAGHQTAGRGRLGRDWASEPGRSLLFSFVLRPILDPERGGLLTLLAGASMAWACREAAGADVGCKWPNDLLLSGRKVGGILTEARVEGSEIRHVVVGVGINLAAPPPNVPEAVGLGGADPALLLHAFLRHFRSRYIVTPAAFGPAVLESWRGVAVTLGRLVRATTVDGRVVQGLARDVDDAGNLIVEADGRHERVAFGDVTHVEAQA
jgi:BirA family transcriptional regulator, biotin operon repressor / biotin---[acetyl-CoA-carboxylase] ligase